MSVNFIKISKLEDQNINKFLAFQHIISLSATRVNKL